MRPLKEIRVIWEFIVRDEYLEQFVHAYSSGGAWALLFEKYTGYLKTELIIDTANAHRFITIDYWDSFDSYMDMKNNCSTSYQSLDDTCAVYTVKETFIGVFEA
ncbi:antibiotic biosynthesis monooxygenase family protein [Desulfofustis limnaeus]|jgi:hypothetical protein|uniref:ABM domain-containing protein n=1 Tax=Desulfofustis limnaeus TaxID=2740163 RepID=A0ABN6M5G1_9BACT|nr:hypothetical protein [Desulfofustis limnaeus]MDX9895280.1 hypothetical protein [Desulfofustis sp.]BDD86534.1 hypothetical protein DPPLL_08990 [Desulfofustis limnaeus]